LHQQRRSVPTEGSQESERLVICLDHLPDPLPNISSESTSPLVSWSYLLPEGDERSMNVEHRTEDEASQFRVVQQLILVGKHEVNAAPATSKYDV
jgi:hypothetical protein